MKFAFIHEHRASFPATLACAVLKVSRSGYHAWIGRPQSVHTIRRRALLHHSDLGVQYACDDYQKLLSDHPGFPSWIFANERRQRVCRA